MKVKTYAILRRAVEEGVKRGYMRAFKHTDTPAPEHVEDEIVTNVMGEICDVFSFDDEIE